jgi:hypothetical protein
MVKCDPLIPSVPFFLSAEWTGEACAATLEEIEDVLSRIAHTRLPSLAGIPCWTDRPRIMIRR